jgi:hypothetical protein
MNITYGTGSCRGWSDPKGYPTLIPTIDYLTQYFSPAGSTTLVVIFGKNFRAFSKILFGVTNPPTIYISSNQIEFYVPTSLLPGSYPVQVFNDTLASNIKVYNIDNSSGYWLLQGNQQITNTNPLGVNVSANVTGAAANTPQLVVSSYTKSGSVATDLSYNLNFITTAQSNTINTTTENGDAVIYTNYKAGSALKPSAINITFPPDPNIPGDSKPKGVRFAPGQTVVSGDLIVYGKILSKSSSDFPDGGQIIAEKALVTPNPIVYDTSDNPIYDPTNSTNYNPTYPYLPSDYRIKENVNELSYDCVVDNLNPIKYLNKQNGRTEIGFLAHEVQEAFPFLVTGTKDGNDIQTLNYIGLIGVLVKEVKELKKEIQMLKEKERI